MVTLLREKFGHPLVHFRHEILDDHHVSILSIERRHIGKTRDTL